MNKWLCVLIVVLLAAANKLYADTCSPYMGRATFNEFFKDQANQSNDSDDFIEIKILDLSLSDSTYNSWTIDVCENDDNGNNNDDDGCASGSGTALPLSGFTDRVTPWLVLKDNSIGQFFNMKTGFDAILRDEDGLVIDYLTVGYSSLQDTDCPGTSLSYDYQAGSPGASDKFWYRSPDGIGPWVKETSAAAPPTEGADNEGVAVCEADRYGIYGAGGLDIKKRVTLNDAPVAEGKTSDSAIELDSTIVDVVLDLPALAALDLTTGADVSLNNSNNSLTAGDYSTVQVASSAEVSLAPGTYNIDYFDVLASAVITIEAGGAVIINTNKFDMDDYSTINAGGAVANLIVNLYNSTAGDAHDNKFHLHKEGVFNGTVFSSFSDTGIEVKKEAVLTGGIFSEGAVKLEDDAQIIYGASEQAAAGAVLGCSGLPTIVSSSIQCDDLSQVEVVFSESIDPAIALANINSNYSLLDSADNSAIAISGAVMSGDDTVVLSTETLADPANYTLTVNNIADLDGEVIVANSTSSVSVGCSVSCDSAGYGIYGVRELDIKKDVVFNSGSGDIVLPEGKTTDNAIDLAGMIIDAVIELPQLAAVAFINSNDQSPASNAVLSPGSYGTVLATADFSLNPGTYNVDFFDVRKDVDITLVAGGPVIINTNKFDMDDRATINAGGDAANLTVNMFSDSAGDAHDNKFHLHKNGSFTGMIFSNSSSVDIDIKDGAVLTGGIFSEGKIKLENNASIVYGTAEQAAAAALLGCSSASGFGYYRIEHSGSGINCEPYRVTVTATSDDGDSIDIAAGTQLTLSTDLANDGWSNPGGVGPSYTVLADSAEVEFFLRRLSPGTLEIDVDDADNNTDDDGERDDDNVIFAAAGFRFYADGTVDDIGLQYAGKSSGVAPGLQVLTIKALGGSDSEGRCEALLLDSEVDIGIAYQCVDPNSCANSSGALTVNGTPVDDSDSVFNAVSLLFNSSGEATFTINYQDAGNIALLAAADLMVSDGSPAAVSGVSEPFLVRPAGLCVRALASPGNYHQCAPSAPAGYDSCTVFRAVDESFDLEVSARAWQETGQSDTDFCDNEVTENFVLANIALVSELLAPSGGVNAGLAASTAIGTGADRSGLVEQALSMDEVGVFNIVASPSASSYHGHTIASSSSAPIGRFKPDHYLLSDGVIIPGTGTFSYLDQPFLGQYDLRAVDAGGQTTANYRDDGAGHNFVKLDLDSQASYGAVDGAGNYFSTRLSAANSGAVMWLAGRASLIQVPLTLARVAGPDGPFTDLRIGVELVDDDLVTLADSALDLDSELPSGLDRQQLGAVEAQFKFGRVAIAPVFGPEISTLDTTDVPVTVQYWDSVSASFKTNMDDSSTGYGGWSWSVGSNCYDPDSSGDTLTCSDTALILPAAPNTVAAGLGLLSINRPGETGTLMMELMVDAWLQYGWGIDWDNSGDSGGDIDPSFQVNFGSFRGHDRIIYWREQHNP